jgi:probable HAF family extracellular repeat protein
MHNAHTAGWTALLTLALAPTTLAQGYRYSVTLLSPLPNHSSLSTNAINNRGEVVGVSYGSPINNQAPYLYRPGVGVEALPLPPGYAFVVPTDINDSGVVVGYAQTTWSDESHPHAWKYENGVYTVYPAISYANGVNNDGVVVGRSCPSGTSLSCFFRADRSEFQTFGSTAGYIVTSWPNIQINTPGQMALAHGTSAAERREVDGTLTPLPPAPTPFVRQFIWSINDPGQITGRYEYNVGSQYYSRAYLWSPETGARTVGVPNTHVRPKGLNNLGHVVGESGGNQNSYLDMWVWTPERGAEDLEPLIDPALQINVTGVSGINDRGEIIGRGIRQVPPVADVWYVLSPIGEPCPVDMTGDGAVNVSDFLAFLSDYAAGATRSDFNADGQVNVSDFLAFLGAYAAGC